MTDRPTVTRMAYTLLVGVSADAPIGEDSGYVGENGEADLVLATTVTGQGSARRFKTTQCGPQGPEPITADMLHDLGAHFLALAVDSDRLPEEQKRAAVAALHEIRRPHTRSV